MPKLRRVIYLWPKGVGCRYHVMITIHKQDNINVIIYPPTKWQTKMTRAWRNAFLAYTKESRGALHHGYLFIYYFFLKWPTWLGMLASGSDHLGGPWKPHMAEADLVCSLGAITHQLARTLAIFCRPSFDSESDGRMCTSTIIFISLRKAQCTNVHIYHIYVCMYARTVRPYTYFTIAQW